MWWQLVMFSAVVFSIVYQGYLFILLWVVIMLAHVVYSFFSDVFDSEPVRK
jgi:hypothetical protein